MQRGLDRRHFLASASAFSILASAGGATAASISGRLPWHAFAGDPPKPVNPAGWFFFTPDEAVTIEAIVDHFIPGDALSVSGKDAGCAVFIDRQLAGSYGKSERLYMKPPFAKGLPTQGYQSALTPSGRYRDGLRAINDAARAAHGKIFAQLVPADQEAMLKDMESGKLDLKLTSGLSTHEFFELMLQNTMEGFFADPLYGGNRDMAGWKLVGFPGARYDYRDHIGKPNTPYPHGPISIYGEG